MKTASRFALGLSTLSLLAGSATALAGSRVGEISTKTVSFRDLDLSTASGAETLGPLLYSATENGDWRIAA